MYNSIIISKFTELRNHDRNLILDNFYHVK